MRVEPVERLYEGRRGARRYLLTWDLPETEDLVQEALLQVARRWRRVRSMQHPRAYARRVLINLAIDGHGRRTRRKDELNSDEGLLDGVDEAAARAVGVIDRASEFRWALAALPRQQRAVVVLRYWEDLPETEVAALLGCSVGTVKSTASRGVARLRQVMSRTDTSAPGSLASGSNERRTT
jgi:RNA polymerase sigma-70 factor (sigma-E family)